LARIGAHKRDEDGFSFGGKVDPAAEEGVRYGAVFSGLAVVGEPAVERVEEIAVIRGKGGVRDSRGWGVLPLAGAGGSGGLGQAVREPGVLKRKKQDPGSQSEKDQQEPAVFLRSQR